MLLAKPVDLSLDHVPHFAGAFEFLPGRPFKASGIGKRPMQTSGYAGEYGTAFAFCFTTDGDHVLKHLTRFPHIKNRLSFVWRNVDTKFLKRLHRQRIESTWLQTGALGFEEFATGFIQQRCCHLTTRTVMNANKKDFLLHYCHYGKRSCSVKPDFLPA